MEGDNEEEDDDLTRSVFEQAPPIVPPPVPGDSPSIFDPPSPFDPTSQHDRPSMFDRPSPFEPSSMAPAEDDPQPTGDDSSVIEFDVSDPTSVPDTRSAGITIGPERESDVTGVSAGPLIAPGDAQPLDLDSLYGPTFEPDPDNAEPPEIMVDKIVTDSRPLLALLGGLFGAAFLGALWWALSRTGDPVIPPDQLASPRAVWDEFTDIYNDQIFRDSIVGTITHFAIAFGIGVAIGSLVGTVAGSLDVAHSVLRPIMGMLRWISPVLIVPFVFLRWSQFSPAAVVWIPAAAVTAGMISWTTTAALVDSRRRLSKNQAERLIWGVRVVMPLTWTVVLLIETQVVEESIGQQVLAARQPLGETTDTIYVYVIVAMVMALIVDGVLRVVQHAVREH